MNTPANGLFGIKIWRTTRVASVPPHIGPAHQRRFALTLQHFALFPHFNVQDNLACGLIEQRVPREQARARARALDMPALMGLAPQAKQNVWTLSGGEQQRVALAPALITQPRLLLPGEPFSALDADLRTQLCQEFTQRISASHIPCGLVTHDEQ